MSMFFDDRKKVIVAPDFVRHLVACVFLCSVSGWWVCTGVAQWQKQVAHARDEAGLPRAHAPRSRGSRNSAQARKSVPRCSGFSFVHSFAMSPAAPRLGSPGVAPTLPLSTTTSVMFNQGATSELIRLLTLRHFCAGGGLHTSIANWSEGAGMKSCTRSHLPGHSALPHV